MARDGYIPSAFAKLHPRYGTPATAIVFCLAVSAVGPWLGRTALGWFVDMSAIGGAIGFGYATASCYVTVRRRRALGLESRSRVALRLSALLGTALSLGFVALLLIPGMPGCLGMQSYVMLGVWIVLGMIFFVLHGKAHALRGNPGL